MTDLTSDPHHRSVDRRRFLQGAAVALGAGALGGPFGALARAAAEPRIAPGRARRAAGAGYGPLYPATDQTTGQQLISLPRGFEYLTFGRAGEVMADGIATPGSHDGMAAFRVGDKVHLVRNHERSAGATFAPASLTYDPLAAGGTTTLVFDPDRGALVESYASLAGTMTNCAGGPSPWGTWLTCEENFSVSAAGKRHGYVFEVPAAGAGNPVPLTALGRFKREAVAIDPSTGIVYMTEDEGQSALYRFVPTTPGDLSSGTVEAMKLAAPNGNDTRQWGTGASSPVEWVPIANPDPNPTLGQPTVRAQAFAAGAAIIARGEGAWFGNGVVYVISTSGGPRGLGQVFALEPGRDVFSSVYTSEDPEVLAAPDNVCVSPRGGIVLCEDGSGVEYLHGLTPAGDIFRFASNDLNTSEWAGATFEPRNGNWLFVNLQSPGITFAITGPWRQGAL